MLLFIFQPIAVLMTAESVSARMALKETAIRLLYKLSVGNRRVTQKELMQSQMKSLQ
jgi:hypothetical protein